MLRAWGVLRVRGDASRDGICGTQDTVNDRRGTPRSTKLAKEGGVARRDK